ncbi:hypothetical protein LJC42_00640 [Eubacteriales bacterium OttesenSCG-928-K08]|nr:hypothetical protein [Eubacteriales bacterium OttesenSCG-928-K08]
MENERKRSRVGTFFRNLLLNNLGLKIMAIFFAMVVWGVVLTTQNPYRNKTIQNVPVSFRGINDLHAKGLVVRGNPLEEQGGVNVRVSVPITSYKDLTADYLTALINLDNVNSVGNYSLTVNASILAPYNQDSRLDTTTPARIDVEIDSLISKSVPVEVRYEGVLPEGYWADEAELSVDSQPISYVQIRGPKQDVQRVSKAICYVALSDRTQTYNGAVELILWDESGEEVDAQLFLDELPAVTVKMQVQPKKTVPIDIMGSLLGVDNLPANYEIYDAIATPTEVVIIGEADRLAEVASLKFEGIDVSGRREAIDEKQRLLSIPEGVRVLGNIEAVDVYVDIREKTSRKEFKAIPITVMGLGSRLSAQLSAETVDVAVEGRVSIVDPLERNDIIAFVDLENIREGTYEDLDVTIHVLNDDVTLELFINQTVAQVNVKVTSG